MLFSGLVFWLFMYFVDDYQTKLYVYVMACSLRHGDPGRKKPRVVIISDTPEVFTDMSQQLLEHMELIRFDYKEYLNTQKGLSAVMNLHYG